MNLKTPEIAGLLVGLADALPRLLAAAWFTPGDGRLYGPLVLANVHHKNGVLGIGLTTMQGFAMAAGLLAIYYLMTRLAAHWLGPDQVGFRWARACLAVVAGVLVLNAGESLISAKVTDYVGLARGTRVWMLNFGDVAITAALLAYLPLMAWAGVSGWRARTA